jgi:hypothetical protein
MSPCRQTFRCAGLRLKGKKDVDAGRGLAGEWRWRIVNRWAVRDDTCTVLCRTLLYALVQHTRESQLTDSDMYLNMFGPFKQP